MERDTRDLSAHLVLVPGAARWWRRRGAGWATAYAFLLPALAILAVFQFWPILQTITLSFTQDDVVSAPQFTGLANYGAALSDPLLLTALRNTALYTVVVVPTLVVWPLILALVVDRRVPAIGVFRTLFYVPVIASMVVVALLWKQLLQTTGPVNELLLGLGIVRQPVPWLTDPRIALFSVMALTVWKSSAYYMVIYLAGLQAIPRDLHEAAAVDGARPWQRVLHVTVPMLRPFMAIVTVVAFIGSMQVFEEIYLVTQGGPGAATTTLVYYVYELAFRTFRFGYATMVSVVLLAVVLSVSILILRFFERGANGR